MLTIDLPDTPMERLWHFNIPYSEEYDAKRLEALGEIVFIAECQDGLKIIVKKEGEVYLDRQGCKFNGK